MPVVGNHLRRATTLTLSCRTIVDPIRETVSDDRTLEERKRSALSSSRDEPDEWRPVQGRKAMRARVMMIRGSVIRGKAVPVPGKPGYYQIDGEGQYYRTSGVSFAADTKSDVQTPTVQDRRSGTHAKQATPSTIGRVTPRTMTTVVSGIDDTWQVWEGASSTAYRDAVTGTGTKPLRRGILEEANEAASYGLHRPSSASTPRAPRRAETPAAAHTTSDSDSVPSLLGSSESDSDRKRDSGVDPQEAQHVSCVSSQGFTALEDKQLYKDWTRGELATAPTTDGIRHDCKVLTPTAQMFPLFMDQLPRRVDLDGALCGARKYGFRDLTTCALHTCIAVHPSQRVNKSCACGRHICRSCVSCR